MAKNKKQDNAEAKEDIVMEVMPGADAVSEEEVKPFEVDLNFDEVPEEEAKDEEVEQEVDAAPEEEVVAEEPEPEVAEEETAEPEAVSEEGVVEDSEPAPQPDIPAVEGSEQNPDGQDKVKAPMCLSLDLMKSWLKTKLCKKSYKKLQKQSNKL